MLQSRLTSRHHPVHDCHDWLPSGRTILPFSGPVTAYAISSLGFALIHANPSALAIYVIQGIILARAYRSRGSLLTAITAHAVNNGIAIAIASLSG
jgi:membrane protease YdiL (CAAX protease family)